MNVICAGDVMQSSVHSGIYAHGEFSCRYACMEIFHVLNMGHDMACYCAELVLLQAKDRDRGVPAEAIFWREICGICKMCSNTHPGYTLMQYLARMHWIE